MIIFARNMSRQEPHIITFDEMKESASSREYAGEMFLYDNFAIVYDTNRMFRDMIEVGVPYRFNDSRLILVQSGEADITANLMTHHLAPSIIGFVSKGSIVQVNNYSTDFKAKVIAFGEEYLSQLAGTPLLQTYEGRIIDVILELTPDEHRLADNYFTQLWQLTRQQLYSQDLLTAHVTSILLFLDLLGKQRQEHLSATTTRTEELFRRFIRLVNTHHVQHRSLAFYADQLCITDKYLCLVVKAASGFTVKDWIDRALTTSAKMLLKRTDLPVSHIADRLNFSHSSAFCKFFKRMTDLTPQEYRERK